MGEGKDTKKISKKSKEKENKLEVKTEKKKEEKKVETVIQMENPDDEEAKRRAESQRAYEENYEAEEKDWERAWKIMKNTITITMPCIFGEEGTFHYKTLIAYTVALLFVLYMWSNITRLQQEIYCCYYIKILGIFMFKWENKGCVPEDGKDFCSA